MGDHGGEREQGNNVTLPDRGNTSEYTIRRLLKEGRQDLVTEMKQGALSANAAAIVAGFRPVTISFSVRTRPEDAAAKIRSLGEDFASQLKEAL